jgi:sugar phosphate isomerase/epimerase
LRVGLFTDALWERPLEEVLDWLAEELPDVSDVEIGTGGYSPASHCDRTALLTDAGARTSFLAALESRGLRLSALNVSGNPLEVEQHDGALRETIQLAGLLGADRVVCMSGGRAELAGAGWFPGLEDETELYWQERVLPYWERLTALARRESDVLRLCFELEPGAAVFNVSTFERVAGLGVNLAVNLDPSHFFWQSIDPLATVRRLGSRVGFAHGKDTVADHGRISLDGLLDRSAWRYATVGHGHDAGWWSQFVDELRRAGYNGPVSIEYEDPLVEAEQSILESARVLVEAGTASEVAL